jgi:flagellin
MTRINTNVISINAKKTLSRTNAQLQESLTRLSSGLRINRGKDDPAGLIASEILRSDIINVERAITNSERANQLIATADSALGQVSTLLNEIRGLVSEAANTGALSEEQISANQLQVDSSLESIDRIARVTSFQGKRLLDGSLGFIRTSPGTIDENATGTAGDAGDSFAFLELSANSGGSGGSDILLTSNLSAASTGNGTTVVLQSGAAAGSETATFNGSQLTVFIESGASTANQIISAINDTPVSGGITAALASGGAGAGVFDGASVAGVISGGVDGNQIEINAVNPGSSYSGASIQFQTGAATGSETATYNATTKTLTVTINAASTAIQVTSAINAQGTFSAAIASGSNGSGVASQTTATLSGGFLEDNLSNIEIDQANFGTLTAIGVTVEVDTQATQAELIYSGGTLTADLTLEVGGKNGFEVFNFGNGTTTSDIASAINLVSDATGVEAAIDGSGNIAFTSIEYGTESYAAVQAIVGTFSTVDTSSVATDRTTGTDVVARINGVSANGEGLKASINTANLDASFNVSERLTDGTSVTFTITGGGATFQLGPDVLSNQQSRLGIQSVSTATLGGVSGTLFELRSGGSKSLDTDTIGAAKVVDEVITKLTSLRGRLGAFQRTTLETNIFTLSDTLENLTEAESAIRDADFAAESALLTRAQILVQSGTSVLAIANQNPQNVLALLR